MRRPAAVRLLTMLTLPARGFLCRGRCGRGGPVRMRADRAAELEMTSLVAIQLHQARLRSRPLEEKRSAPNDFYFFAFFFFDFLKPTLPALGSSRRCAVWLFLKPTLPALAS